nr:hypothetical protein [Tanacetum cinerariifolium]
MRAGIRISEIEMVIGFRTGDKATEGCFTCGSTQHKVKIVPRGSRSRFLAPLPRTDLLQQFLAPLPGTDLLQHVLTPKRGDSLEM